MDEFKKNITNVSKEDRDKYFQMPQEFEEYVEKKDKKDTSIEGQKKRLEEQLYTRQHYVELLEQQEISLKKFINEPNDDNKLILKVAKAQVDLHNIEIEITAQKNVFVDTYIYYKEDFMKRYREGGGKKKSVFTDQK